MSSKKTPRTLIGDYMDVVSAQIIKTKPNSGTSLTHQSHRALGKDHHGESSFMSELGKEETLRPKVGFTASQPVYSSNVDMHLSQLAKGNKSVDFDSETPRFYIQRLMQNATPKTPKVSHPKTAAPDSIAIPVVPDTFETPSPFQSSDSGDFDINAEETHYHYSKDAVRQKGTFHLNIPQEMEQIQQKSFSKHSRSEYQPVRVYDVPSNEKRGDNDLNRVESQTNWKFNEGHLTSSESQDLLNSQKGGIGNLLDVSSQKAKGQTRSFFYQDVQDQYATGLDVLSRSMSSRDHVINVQQKELPRDDRTQLAEDFATAPLSPMSNDLVSVSQQVSSAKRSVTMERNVWQDISLETMNISPELSTANSPITNIHVTDSKQSGVKEYFMTSGLEDSDESIGSLNPSIMSSTEAFQHLNATGHEILQSRRRSSVKSLTRIVPEAEIPVAFVGSNEINVDKDGSSSKEISSNISEHSYTEISPRSSNTNIVRQSLEPDTNLPNVSTPGNASNEIQMNRSNRKSTGSVNKVAYPLNFSFDRNDNYNVAGGISELDTSGSSAARIMHTGQGFAPRRSAQNSSLMVVVRAKDVVGAPSSNNKDSSHVSNQGIPTTSMVDLSQRKIVSEVFNAINDQNDDMDVHGQLNEEMEVVHEEEARSSTTVKTIARQKHTRKPRMKSNFTLPLNTVKKHFTHYANMKLSKEAVEEVMNLSEIYWNIVCTDLEAYARHAGRTKISQSDIELLFKRQGHVTQKQSLNSLIAKYLPMEERQKLIYVARAGNRLEPTL